MSRPVECPVHEAARHWRDNIGLATPARTFRFDEMERQVESAANRLRAKTTEGARIAFLMPNDWRLVVLILATIRAGRVAAPLSMRWPSERLSDLLGTVDAALFITENESASQVGECVRPETLLGEAGEGEMEELDLDQPATLIFTSGSMGEPKAVLHTLGNHLLSARGANHNIPLAPGDRWLLALPLYHVGGLAILFRCLLAGATAVIPTPDSSLVHTIRQQRITHLSLVATQLHRLLAEATDALPDLKAILLGGSAIPPALLDAALARGLPVHTSYGLTETASQVTATPPDAALETLRTSGRVLPYRAVRIAADGEIHVRGAVRFAGYFEGSVIHRPFDPDGWFATGDLGRFNAQERLIVEGRKDNRIISGGENIQAEAIERALMHLDGVTEAIVVPVPDAEFGHRPVAFVRGAAMLDELPHRLAPVLPRYMIPDAFYPWPVEAGIGAKPDRQVLAQLAAVKQSH